MLEIFAYRTVAVMHFTDQNWISKTIYCIRRVMVCKIGFTNWNAKIALLRAFMVLTYYIKLFRTWADRHNDILMSLLLLVAEAKKVQLFSFFLFSLTAVFFLFSYQGVCKFWKIAKILLASFHCIYKWRKFENADRNILPKNS